MFCNRGKEKLHADVQCNVVLTFYMATAVTACCTTESVDNIRSNNRFQKLVATTSHRAGHQIQNLLSSLFGLRSFSMFTIYKVWGYVSQKCSSLPVLM